MASHSASDKPQSAMAQLLAKHKDKFVTLKKGESVKAKITKLTSSEIFVDAGAKTEALVLEKDKRILHSILSMFKEGDTVEANVLNPESESGQPIVSLRRYLGGLAWKKLEELEKSKEMIEVVITDVAKAGYVVNTDFGTSGFLPQAHAQQKDLHTGQKLNVTVIELSRRDNKVIFSQKPALSEADFAKLAKQYKVGQKLEVTISNIMPFGLFITLPVKDDSVAIEGFIHISEASWDKVEDLSALYSPGQKIEAAVLKFDTDTRRINFSIKRLTKDPFEALMENYPVDKKVQGTVSKVDNTGVTVALTEDIEGLIKKEKIPPTTTYTVGQTVTVTVSEHDKKRHKLILTPVLLEKPLGYR